jgi:hypothetical protein
MYRPIAYLGVLEHGNMPAPNSSANSAVFGERWLLGLV